MTKKQVDVIILGLGLAGIAAAHEVSKVTQNFVIIDEAPLGAASARLISMPHSDMGFVSRGLVRSARVLVRRMLAGRVRRPADEDAFPVTAAPGKGFQEQGFLRRASCDERDLVPFLVHGDAGEFVDADSILAGDTIYQANVGIIVSPSARAAIPEEFRGASDFILRAEEFLHASRAL